MLERIYLKTISSKTEVLSLETSQQCLERDIYRQPRRRHHQLNPIRVVAFFVYSIFGPFHQTFGNANEVPK